MAPIDRNDSSSETKRNRSWPGVPNRYSTRSWLRVIRPKSIATVVVCLDSTPSVSSTPTLSSVRYSSVSSGCISLTAPTRVVLPTPKPPAIRIFRATGSASASTPVSEGPKAIEDRLEYALVRDLRRRHGGACPDVAPVEQVAQQDPDGARGQVQDCGDLRNRDGVLAESDDPSVLGLQSGVGSQAAPGRDDQGDQVELSAGRARAARRHRVVPHDRAGVLVDPDGLGWVRCHHETTTIMNRPPS